MKKTIALFAGIICILSFSACGEKTDSTSESIVESSNSEIAEQKTTTQQKTTSESSLSKSETDENSEQENSNRKTLVVYYSASGNTAGIAEYIADETGGDLFEIQPVNIYSDSDLDWTNPQSRVCVEHDNPDQRNVELVSTTVEGWDSYETVFIGYPIWWGIAAWPVDNFVKSNDFSDKTVIPFCTSASSGIGESGKQLADLAGTGNWQDGKRFRSGASKSDIQDWIKSLNLN